MFAATNCDTLDGTDKQDCDVCDTANLYYLGVDDQCVLCTTKDVNCTGVNNDGVIQSCSGTQEPQIGG